MAANWKMYKTADQTTTFFNQFIPLLDKKNVCEVVICPTALSIPTAVSAASGTNIHIGGQNMYWEKEGPFTGEISGEMLCAGGATWVIVGHSERRQCFHETDADVLKKTQAALNAGLSPIVCIGEKPDEHKAGKTNAVIVRQFAAGVAGLTEEQFAKISIAYEPIWAIGTGNVATPEIASAAHQLVRCEAEKRFGAEASRQLRIIYGGSVKPENIKGLMAESEIDGVLVGGASLDPQSFATIVKAA
jgi:triosephosphate isomerase (TIM)